MEYYHLGWENNNCLHRFRCSDPWLVSLRSGEVPASLLRHTMWWFYLAQFCHFTFIPALPVEPEPLVCVCSSFFLSFPQWWLASSSSLTSQCFRQVRFLIYITKFRFNDSFLWSSIICSILIDCTQTECTKIHGDITEAVMSVFFNHLPSPLPLLPLW